MSIELLIIGGFVVVVLILIILGILAYVTLTRGLEMFQNFFESFDEL